MTDLEEIIGQFSAAIADCGLTPPDVVEPGGELHRFATNGKAGDDAGWYVLHVDGHPAGAFGCHRSRISENWSAKGELSPRDEASHRERMKGIQKKRESDKVKRQAEAREEAKEIWRTSEPATDDHPYLVKKGVRSHGLHVCGSGQHKGKLIVPVSEGTAIHSLQFIPTEGKKKFLAGARVQGCYYPIGEPEDTLCIAEGFATAATIREITGLSVAVAFSAHGLLPVAQSLRAKYPDLKLIICADDDPKEDGSNPGLTAAQEAAQEMDAPLAVPDFGDDRPEGASDFNDLLQHAGPEVVRLCIERPEAESRTEPVTAVGLLDAAGVVVDLEGVDAIADSLRQLVQVLREAEADPLLRAAVRAEAITRLKGPGLKSPAAMVDAALLPGDDSQEDERSGHLLLEDVEPWHETVDGPALMASVARTIVRYAILPEGAATAIGLWVVFAYAHDAAVVSPLLAITSPTKRCGKTTLMMLVSALVPRALPVSNISTAALFRAVEAFDPTLLIDEADSFLKEREELRGVLNSGHSRTMAYVVRCDGEDNEARTFSTWCPKVVALIGQLPDTLTDRSINISMRRKGPGERAEKLRLDRLDLEDLRRKAARWVEDHGDELRNADPAVPDSLDDRAADNWRPLLAIADAVGGKWPERARRSAEILSGGQVDDGAAGPMLLEDLKKFFIDRGTDRLGSADIVEMLGEMEERPWPEWRQGHQLTQRGLAKLLEPFGVKPRLRRIAGETKAKRGYDREDLEDAWTRYLVPDDDIRPDPPVSSVTSVTMQAGPTFPPDSQVLQSDECNTCENAENPRQDCDVTDVTLANPPSGGKEELEPETNQDEWTEA